MTRGTTRRAVLRGAGALLVGACGSSRPVSRVSSSGHAIVVGAGAFGGWTAWFLRARGLRVTLVDALGPGNERSSSGGETRLMREDYGSNELYMRLAIRSFVLWRRHQAQWRTRLFTETGRLVMAAPDAVAKLADHAARLRNHGVATELLSPDELRRRWPQMFTDDIAGALYNPNAALMHAQDACRAVARALVEAGGELVLAQARLARDARRGQLELDDGTKLDADTIVFACGPWLPKLFPALFARRMTVIRRDVLFFGTPPGDRGFRLPNLPTWGFRGASPRYTDYYGFPDVDGVGFKVVPMDKDIPIDPEMVERHVSEDTIRAARAFLAHRFPRLADQPIVGTRVCQTTDTETSDFVIDRHPDLDNIWLAGGCSGHGFKHGPAIGEYLATRIVDGAASPELDEAFRLRRPESGAV